MEARRLLITGSRLWADWITIRYALAAEWSLHCGAAVLVSGNCPQGADYICEQTWELWGGTVERYPARWDMYGKRAGFVRNAEMAALPGVYKCLGFSLAGSRGTAHCMDQARKQGIPVSPFERMAVRRVAL